MYVGVTATGSRDGKPFEATHLCRTTWCTSRCHTSLRSTPEAMLQLVRDRLSIEAWFWICATQLHEDAHRYRGNGDGAMASLRTAAINLLRLAGFRSIRAEMQSGMHDITALLAMALRQPQHKSR